MKYPILLFAIILGSCIGKPGAPGDTLTLKKLEELNKKITADTSGRIEEYYEEGMTLAKTLPDSTREINLLCTVGDHYYENSSWDTAVSYYRKALLVSQQQQLQRKEITCRTKISAAQIELEQYPQAITEARLALALSTKSGMKEEMAGALEELGIIHYNQRSYDSALIYYSRELEIDKELKKQEAVSACLNNMAIIYGEKGDYSKSIFYYQQTAEIKKALGDSSGVAQAQANIGIAYKNNGAYDLALENLLRAARLFEKQKLLKEQFSCYTTIGNVFLENEELEKALLYHSNALQLSRTIGYQRGTAIALTNVGEVYMHQRKFAPAKDYLNQSLALKEKLGDKVRIASSLGFLGEISFMQQDYTAAENYYRRSLSATAGIEDPKGTAAILNNLAELYLNWQKYDSAFSNLTKARTIAERSRIRKALLDNYELSRKAYQQTGDLSNALLYADQHAALKDTLRNEKKAKAIEELQIKYQAEKSSHEISLMKETAKKNEAVVERQYTMIYFLVTGAGLLIIIAVLALIAYRSRKKAFKQSELIVQQKQALIEQKQVVMRELHHRVKNNLQVLSDVLALQQGRVKDENTQNALKAVEQRMHAMLLIHRELYNDQQEAHVNMKEYFEKLTDNLRDSYGFSKSGIKVTFDVDDIKLDADKALNIGFICNEIISNSFKHAFKNTTAPELTIRLKAEPGFIRIEIADNGPGIHKELDPEKSGSFGLRLIQLFLKDLHGSINIANPEQGSRFELLIPHS